MNEIYIQSIMTNLKQLEIAKEKLNQEIKENELILKHYMIKNSLEELEGYNHEKVIYKEVLGKRFDSKEFKKNFEGLYNAYLKSTKNFRFKFTY